MQIEQNFPVTDLIYKDVPIWSVLRAAIGRSAENYFLNPGRLIASAHERHQETRQALEELAREFSFSQPQGSEIETLSTDMLASAADSGQTDVLFFSWPERSYHFNAKGCYNQEDFLYDLIEDSFKLSKLEIISKNTENSLPRWKNVTLLRDDLNLHSKLFKTWVLLNYGTSLRAHWRNLYILKKITRHLIRNYREIFGFSLYFKLIHEVEYIFQRTEQLKQALAAIKPKIIISNIYYNRDALSCLFAAKQLGIPYVEVINGAVGKYHWAYTSNQYHQPLFKEIVPDIFWVWDKQSKEYMNNSQIKDEASPDIIVGGNIRYEYWYYQKNQCDQPLKPLSSSLSSPQRYRVLFTHQYVNIIPHNLIRAMLASDQQIEWIFRLHPQSSLLKETYEVFFAKMACNVTVELSTDISIFDRLANCDHLITEFSTTAIEALNFGIPVTLISDLGETLFENYLTEGKMKLKLDADELAEEILYQFKNKNHSARYQPASKPAVESIHELIQKTKQIRHKLITRHENKNIYEVTPFLRLINSFLGKVNGFYKKLL